MKKIIFLSILFSLPLPILFLIMSTRIVKSDDIGQLDFLLFLLFLLIDFIIVTFDSFWAIFRWKKYGIRSILPVVISLVIFGSSYLAIILGIKIRDIVFHNQLPRYQKMIALINDGTIINEGVFSFSKVPDEYKNLAFLLKISKDLDGKLTVEFTTDGGFPVKHGGYLYKSTGYLDAQDKRNWPFLRKVENNWYEFSD